MQLIISTCVREWRVHYHNRHILMCLALAAEGSQQWTAGHSLLQVQRVGGQVSSLHQPARGVWSPQAGPWHLLHHPIHLWTQPGGRLPSQTLLREAQCIQVSISLYFLVISGCWHIAGCHFVDEWFLVLAKATTATLLFYFLIGDRSFRSLVFFSDCYFGTLYSIAQWTPILHNRHRK